MPKSKPTLIPVVESARRSDLYFMERRLLQFGCTPFVTKAQRRQPGKITRVFVLNLESTEYQKYFGEEASGS